ncbi:MAG: GlcG/HbpS family heme-binding protein [Desulfuromonadales bacterium]
MTEQLATRQTLTLAVVKKIAEAAEKKALANGWNVVIAIVDEGANLFYLQRMDDTQLASIDIALNKALSAIKYKRPTKAFEDSLIGGRQAVLKLPGAMPVEGGLPLTCNGEFLGAIGVSGVQGDEDGMIARAGVDALAKLACP